MPRAAVNLQSLARTHTETCIRTLARIVSKGKTESARTAAAGMLLDRGWGRPATTYSGPDGEGSIQVIVRHIINGHDAPATIDHSPIVSVSDDTQD